MSDTPETDMEWFKHQKSPVFEISKGLLDFARKLERKCNSLRRELAEALEHQEVPFHTCSGKDCKNKGCRLRHERDRYKLQAAANWKLAVEFAKAAKMLCSIHSYDKEMPDDDPYKGGGNYLVDALTRFKQAEREQKQ